MGRIEERVHGERGKGMRGSKGGERSGQARSLFLG